MLRIVCMIALIAGFIFGYDNMNAKAVVPDARPLGIVRIVELPSGMPVCTAAVVSDKLAVTAAHCFRGRKLPAAILLCDGSMKNCGAVSEVLIAREERSDLALLVGTFKMFKPLKATTNGSAIEASLKRGHLSICGYAWQGDLYCSAYRDAQPWNFQISGSGFMYPGMSGGPLIDLDSNTVIGINSLADAHLIVTTPLTNMFGYYVVGGPGIKAPF